MKKNLTEIVFIIDRSGSMSGLEADTIGGFNSLIEKQKSEEGEALVSVVLFNDDSKVVYDRADISKIEPMTRQQYVPAGCTALLDAVGSAVSHIGNVHKYARDEDVPEKTLFVITTDGMENASRNYDYARVKHMIERQQEKYDWEFMFLGANIDAAAAAQDIGIAPTHAMEYHADSMGTEVMYEAMACAVSDVRGGGLTENWRKVIDRDNKRRKKK